MSTGFLFAPPPACSTPAGPTAATAHASSRTPYMDREERDRNRIHVFTAAGRWATWVPAWRPDSFAPDGVTHLPPYGETLHDSRAAAMTHVRAYLTSDDAAADRDEMLRLLGIGGPTYVRALPNSAAHAGRVHLDDLVARAPWARLS